MKEGGPLSSAARAFSVRRRLQIFSSAPSRMAQVFIRTVSALSADSAAWNPAAWSTA